MTFRFVIDEGSIDLNGLSSEDGCEVIEELLDLIDDARRNGDNACYDDELFHKAILDQRTFWDLFDPESPIYLPHDISERAAAIFGSMSRWYEIATPQPTSVDISIDGAATETSASVAWAHQQAIQGGLQSAACICALGERPSGAIDVDVAGTSKKVWFVNSIKSLDGYFRWLISEHATHPDHIASLASSAFRQLDFVAKCFDGISKMSKSCRLMAPEIVHHLSVLSDEGPRIFSQSWDKAPQEFGSFGVDISDENGGTKSNSEAKKERLREFNGRELYFWWHTKIEGHQDRIHIYPNDIDRTKKIVVGIFCKHLTV